MSASSHNLASVKSTNTRPELYVRSGLHRNGLRFRLHNRNLPGTPDLYFAKHKLCLFINGCFWHRHDCHLFKWPKTREEFWRNKITRNQQRDRMQFDQLLVSGYRVGIVWECSIKGKLRIPEERFFEVLIGQIVGSEDFFEILGSTI